MKKIWFNIITLLLMTVIVAAMIALMFTGRGVIMSGKVKSMAEDNADKIKVEERQLPTGRAQLDYDPYESRQITEDTFNHIYVDGERCDFPINLNQLPDSFSWVITSCNKNGDSTGDADKYIYWVNLYYNDVLWAYGFFYSDVNNHIPEDIVITDLALYANEGSEYVPQIVVGGFDIGEADIRSINKAFGYGTDEYGYEYLYAPADDGKNTIKVCLKSLGYDGVCITRLEYLREEYVGPVSDLIIYDDSMELKLPEDYDVNKDEVNNSLKYQSIPEDNKDMKVALENMRVHGKTFALPCTVNAMIDAFCYDEQGNYIMKELDSIVIYNSNIEKDEDYGVQIISFKDTYGELEFTAILKPGQDIGDATVISVASEYITFDNIHSIYKKELEGTGESGFEYDVNYTFTSSGPMNDKRQEYFKHYLTDYEYNNVYVETVCGAIGYVKVSYWPENLEKMN